MVSGCTLLTPELLALAMKSIARFIVNETNKPLCKLHGIFIPFYFHKVKPFVRAS
jgi:hypothetical protein